MKFEKEEKMKCDNCGSVEARIRQISRTYDKGKDFLVIKNIPVVDCPNCGQSYMTANTLHEIERIKLHRKNFGVKRPVRVAEYPNKKAA